MEHLKNLLLTLRHSVTNSPPSALTDTCCHESTAGYRLPNHSQPDRAMNGNLNSLIGKVRFGKLYTPFINVHSLSYIPSNIVTYLNELYLSY